MTNDEIELAIAKQKLPTTLANRIMFGLYSAILLFAVWGLNKGLFFSPNNLWSSFFSLLFLICTPIILIWKDLSLKKLTLYASISSTASKKILLDNLQNVLKLERISTNNINYYTATTRAGMWEGSSTIIILYNEAGYYINAYFGLSTLWRSTDTIGEVIAAIKQLETEKSQNILNPDRL